MRRDREEVLIVGAGPTGLFTACELIRHGVRPRIIDQELHPHTQTRATGVQPAALELLHRAGLAGKFMATGVPVKGLRILDHRWEEAFAMGRPEEGTPFPHTISMAQWQTEHILNERLEEEGIKVERGTQAVGFDIRDDSAVVECKAPDGSTFEIEADYLVGSGGAHSPVRAALDQPLAGITYPKRYFVADVASRGAHRGDYHLSVGISPLGMLMVAELPLGRTLVVCDLPDGLEPAATPTKDDAEKIVNAHLTRPFEIVDLRWGSVYRTHRRMSPTFRVGRSFLAGDAAHLCSPLGGEGMNSGFLDGASLAWMLGAVLRRGGRPALLDAYDPERRDVSRQVLASSEAIYDFYYKLVAQAAAGETLHEPPEDPTRHLASPAMLALAIRESPILGMSGTVIGPGRLLCGSRFAGNTKLTGPLHHLLGFGNPAGLDACAETWKHALNVIDGSSISTPQECGVSGQGAVLVRPDGYIGFIADPFDPAAFDRYFGGLFA
jgi:2-polyprenyl-6-methoxyphenol hydroxylase-like FAD-dependent oxidoreductase